jgi:hypothetical protein
MYIYKHLQFHKHQWSRQTQGMKKILNFEEHINISYIRTFYRGVHDLRIDQGHRDENWRILNKSDL